MKSSWFILFIVVFFLIYAAINYYIGYRGWQAFSSVNHLINSKVYWFVFWFIALAYIIARLTQKFLPSNIGQWLTVVGAYWMAAMVYFLLILLFIDVIKLFDKGLPILPSFIKNNPVSNLVIGFIILGMVISILIYGTWNANRPVVQHYDLKIHKMAGSLQQLHAVMVSDIHLGTIIHNGQLTKMVNMINEIQPDIVLLPGDVIDEDIEVVIEQKMAETFRKLNPRFGVYAVFGNHENIGGHGNEVEHYLKEGGIKVLRDSYVKVEDSFYVVGRNDMASKRFGENRKQLSSLIDDIDQSLPIILLDHQPSNLKEAEKQGIDLQLSGHTHRGQFFPIQYITELIFEKDYGYLRKDNFQLIVSSGYGTWGPPIRVGNKPEIVDLLIEFTK